MIDLSLLPARFREGWTAVCAYAEGAGMHIRSTMEMGDILMPLTTSRPITALDDRE